ncbi:hypothetical protein LCGC14_3004880, partial [marine sediment metagenome]
MDSIALAEIVTAVVMVLGGQKGLEIYKRKRFANGNGGHDRRKSNSFADSDKEFIKGCFENQTLKLVMELGKVVRT